MHLASLASEYTETLNSQVEYDIWYCSINISYLKHGVSQPVIGFSTSVTCQLFFSLGMAIFLIFILCDYSIPPFLELVISRNSKKEISTYYITVKKSSMSESKILSFSHIHSDFLCCPPSAHRILCKSIDRLARSAVMEHTYFYRNSLMGWKYHKRQSINSAYGGKWKRRCFCLYLCLWLLPDVFQC